MSTVNGGSRHGICKGYRYIISFPVSLARTQAHLAKAPRVYSALKAAFGVCLQHFADRTNAPSKGRFSSASPL